MHALEVYVYVIAKDFTVVGLGMVLEVAAELANGTNSLLPISLDLGNSTLVVDEVANITRPEAVLSACSSEVRLDCAFPEQVLQASTS